MHWKGRDPQRRPQRQLDRWLEEVAEAVGGGYCRLQMPLRLALGVRGTVAGHRLGALEGGGGVRDLLELGGEGGEGVQGRGGRGSRGEAPPPPPPVGTYLVHREQKIYWATNHSAHGNVILLVANKANSSLQVNSGFPHLSKTQQIQQSGTFTISCQLTVLMVNQN